MPRLDHKKECALLGCHNTPAKYDRFCHTHGGKDKVLRDNATIERNKGYSTAAWKRTRIAALSRNPLCQCCLTLNRITVATHVDHVLPRRHGEHLTPSLEALQCLCLPCHSRKTKHEHKGLIYDWRTGTLVIHRVQDLQDTKTQGFRIA